MRLVHLRYIGTTLIITLFYIPLEKVLHNHINLFFMRRNFFRVNYIFEQNVFLISIDFVVIV